MALRLTRRALLLAALPAAAQAQTALLAPDAPTLSWPGRPGTITLPGWSARTMALPPIADTALTAVALTDASPESTLELLLLAWHSGTAPRILALEPLQWQSPEARLNARIIPGGDAAILILDRTAAQRRSPTYWQRESWRDFLGWRAGLIADTPLRPPPRNSQQAALAQLRARAYAWLATPRTALLPRDLAALGLTARDFTLG